MEYLIASRDWMNSQSQEEIKKIFDEYSIYDQQKLQVFQSDGFNVFFMNGTLSVPSNDRKHRLSIFDGYLFGTKLHHSMYNSISYSEARSYLKSLKRLSGGFCIGHCNSKRNAFEVAGDILGQYRIFYTHQAPQRWALSNCPEILAHFTERKATPTVGNLLMNCSYLSAFNSAPVFEEIQVAKPGQGFSFDTEQGFRLTTRSTRTSLMKIGPPKYKDALQGAASEIKRNCGLIADFTQEHGIHTVVDLSGGIDSRMVLAGFIAAGRKDDVTFYNVNNESDALASTDRVIAVQLQKKFKLKAGAGVGETIRSTTVLNSQKPFSGTSKCSFGTAHYFGMLPYAFDDFGDTYLKGFCRVGGYCGEHSRAPGPNLGLVIADSPTPDTITDAYIRHCTSPGQNNAFNYMLPAAIDPIRESFRSYFAEILDDEIAPRLINTITYVENRSANHFGIRTQNGNKSRVAISPLSTPRLVALHKKLKIYGESFDNKIAHDLILLMGGEDLCYTPMAGNFWRARITVRDSYTGIESSETESRPVQADDVFKSPIVLANGGHQPVSNAAFAAWCSKHDKTQTNESLFAFLLDTLSEADSVWSLVDRNKISELCKSARSKDETIGMNISRLMSAMLFYSGETRRSKLKDVIDVPSLMRERGIA